MDGFMLTQQYSAISVMKISYLYSSVIVSALCILNVGVLPQTLMTVKINGVIFFFFSFVEEHALGTIQVWSVHKILVLLLLPRKEMRCVSSPFS